MNEQETARKIDTLEYLDQETVRVYDAAIPKVDDEEVSRRLQTFRDDHERHVSSLTALSTQPTGTGPGEQFRAFMEEHLRVVEQATGQDQALEGLLLVERANLAEYRRAMESDLSGEAAEIAKRHYEDEQRHVSLIEQHFPALTGISGVAHDALHGRGGGGGL